MLSGKIQGGLRSGNSSHHPTISMDFNLLSSLFRLCPILFKVEFQTGCSFICSINPINHLSWLSYGKHWRCINGHDPVLTLLWGWDRGDNHVCKLAGSGECSQNARMVWFTACRILPGAASRGRNASWRRWHIDLAEFGERCNYHSIRITVVRTGGSLYIQ